MPDGIPALPYVAPHTAKIHTLITLGIHRRAKQLVLKSRKRVPRGFDSHRPLHPQATPGHVGLPDWRQHIGPMGKSWEFDAHSAAVESPHVSLHCPKNHTYSHTQQFAGGWTRSQADRRECPLAARGSRFDRDYDWDSRNLDSVSTKR